jgi:hypothetical protein
VAAAGNLRRAVPKGNPCLTSRPLLWPSSVASCPGAQVPRASTEEQAKRAGRSGGVGGSTPPSGVAPPGALTPGPYLEGKQEIALPL